MAMLFALPAAAAQAIHFSSEEPPDVHDATLFVTTKHSIDLASYALTDPIVLDALNGARNKVMLGLIEYVLKAREAFFRVGFAVF